MINFIIIYILCLNLGFQLLDSKAFLKLYNFRIMSLFNIVNMLIIIRDWTMLCSISIQFERQLRLTLQLADYLVNVSLTKQKGRYDYNVLL